MLNARHLFAHNGWTAVADSTNPRRSPDSDGTSNVADDGDTSARCTTCRRSGVSPTEAAALTSQPDVLVAKLLLYVLKVSGYNEDDRACSRTSNLRIKNRVRSLTHKSDTVTVEMSQLNDTCARRLCLTYTCCVPVSFCFPLITSAHSGSPRPFFPTNQQPSLCCLDGSHTH